MNKDSFAARSVRQLFTLLVVSMAILSPAKARSPQSDLSASWLGKSYDQVLAEIPSCNSTGNFFSLNCRVTFERQPADVLFEFGAGRQAQKISINFVAGLSNDRATSLYNTICQRLQSQFPSVTEEKKVDIIRRIFIQPNAKMAIALFMSKNAAPNQVSVEMSILPAASR